MKPSNTLSCPCVLVTTYRTISPFPSMHAHDSSRVVSIGVNNCSLYCKAARNPQSALRGGVNFSLSFLSNHTSNVVQNNYHVEMKIASVGLWVILHIRFHSALIFPSCKTRFSNVETAPISIFKYSNLESAKFTALK